MKHSFRQDLQDYQYFFWFSIAISCPSCLPGRSVLAKTGWSCQKMESSCR